MSLSETPLDYMAIEPSRQGKTSISLSIVADAANKQLNSDYLRVVSFEGQESVSQPYSFTITLRANEIPANAQSNPDSDFEDLPASSFPTSSKLKPVQGIATDLLAHWSTITLGNQLYPLSANDKAAGLVGEHSNDSSSGGSLNDPLWRQIDSVTVPDDAISLRHFSGIITSISQAAPGEYTAVMQSPLYPLTLRNKFYIFQQMNIEGVIKALLSPELARYSNQVNLKFNIQGLAATRCQDWMQAGENDFSMLQRIMKKAAVHFYFVHDEDKVTIVFSNQPTSPKEVNIPGAKNGQVSLRYSYLSETDLGLQQGDLFCNLSYQVQMTAKSLGDIGTLLTRKEAVWETNNVASFDNYPAKSPSQSVNYLFYKTYHYGLGKSASDSQGNSINETTEIQLQLQQELACQESSLSGECTSNLLSPGYTFVLTQQAIGINEVSGQIPQQFDGRTFVVTQIKHQVTESSPYSGSVQASPLPEKYSPNNPNATLITPPELEDTHQGSVMAVVLKSAVPKNAYFFEKKNFDPQTSTLKYDGEQVAQKQMGCVVRFATDMGTDVTHWVALSDSSQTVPAVNSIVLVARGDSESEIPQIQQVLASHGQKNIQPNMKQWKNQNWSINSSWGSNCNTSYGDSMSIHYGNNVTVNLDTAQTIVTSAYTQQGPLGDEFGSTNFNKGCSFSYSTTEKGAQGLASASVSQGSSFSERYSDQDYNISFTNTSQSFSKNNKRVSISRMESFTDTPDENNLSFINGKLPRQDIIELCDKLPDGSSFDKSYTSGRTISLSGHEAEPPDIDPSSVTVSRYSHSIIGGDAQDTSNTYGNNTSQNTVKGDRHSHNETHGDSNDVSHTHGNSTSLNTVKGNRVDTTNTIGTTTSISNFIGIRTDISNHTGASISETLFEGARTDTSKTIGITTSDTTFAGAKSDTTKHLAACNNNTLFVGAKLDTSIMSAASNTTSITLGTSTTENTFDGAQTENSTTNGILTTTKINNAICTETSVKNGIVTKTEDINGAEADTKTGEVAAYTDERVKAVQLDTVNVTIEAILSIL
ncbi:hypothetical protein tinsulaeT_37050 [Thalassotalea insulae]|uniref:Uncharacterized protein n=1 Tax=Thalassotalea insulae TaxID=2056778 RepID=A0ABQ6H0U2_9GAMM|nr:contractile injection system protein, VgrG/Pvc8 family [Thalassotalea insulae]GLX80365.1 hypothetical protein tinsulaeT_37050 [Thalassotalea insulae]